jgi:CHASE2 domain-containing sensor protein
MWAVGLAASALVSAASSLNYLERWQAGALDLLHQLQGRQRPSDVVIVAIDEAAFDGLGRRQPIARDYLARVVRGVAKSGAAVVGLDITFSTATADDTALATALRAFDEDRTRGVVLLGPLANGGPLGESTLGPLVTLASPSVPSDSDDIIRRVDPVVPGPNQGIYPTLGLAVTARFAGLDGRALGEALAAERPLALPRLHSKGGLARAGSPPVVARAGTEWPINYVGPRGSFLMIPSDLMATLGDAAAPHRWGPPDAPARRQASTMGVKPP